MTAAPLKESDLSGQDQERFYAQANEVIGQLAIVLKTLFTHELGNQLFNQLLASMVRALRSMGSIGGGKVLYAHQGDLAFVNGNMVKLNLTTYQAHLFIAKVLKKIKVGALKFPAALNDGALRQWCAGILQRWNAEDQGALGRPFSVAGIEMLSLAEREERLISIEDDATEHALNLYVRLMLYCEEFHLSLSQGQPKSLRQVRHLLHMIVDSQPEQSALWQSFILMPHYRTKQSSLMAREALLAIMMAGSLGLQSRDKVEVALVGVLRAACGNFLQDLRDFQNSEADLQGHQSVRRSLLTYHARFHAYTEAWCSRAISSYEYSIPFDGTPPSGIKGYLRTMPPHLYGQISALCGAYIELCVGNAAPMRPDQAMHRLLSFAGTLFNPALVKLLARTIGLFPVGTLVKLTDGSVGIVWKQSPRTFNRPLVKIMRHAGKEALQAELFRDLDDLEAEPPSIVAASTISAADLPIPGLLIKYHHA